MFKKHPVPENFYRQVAALVIPMAIQNLINVGVSSADIIMLGKLSQSTMSAVSVANQVQYIMTLILFGIGSGATVLNAQYWGRRNLRAIEMVLGISMRAALAVTAFFAVAGIAAPRFAMGIFTTDPALIEYGSQYLEIVAFSYIMQGFTMTMLNTLKSMERVTVSTVTYGLSFLWNVVVNYGLIFGEFGLPELGVRGAAIGTLTARTLEVVIVVYYMRRLKGHMSLHLKDMFRTNRELRKDFHVFALPIVINELFWGAGMAAATAIYGHINPDVVAANSVAQVSRQLFMVVVFGIAGAAAILVGKKIGEGRPKLAEAYAYHLNRVAVSVAVVAAGLMLLVKGPIARGFVETERAVHYLDVMLIMMAFYIIAQAFSATVIVGILRAGGDSKIGLYIDILTMWCGSLLFAFLGAFVFHWPVEWVIVAALSDEFLKIPLAWWRYRKKIWLRNITREEVEKHG